MRRMRARAIMFLLLLAGAARAELAPGQFVFEYRDGLCRLEANEASVNAILAEVARVTAIRITADPADASTITVRIADRDVEELVDAIASGSVVTYGRDPETGGYFIEEIRTSRAENPQVKQRQIEQLREEQARMEWKPPPLKEPVRYSGIGAGLQLTPDGRGVILFPLSPESPAAKAGITPGTHVSAVDGRPVSEFGGMDELATAIRGPSRTTVTLTVRRGTGEEVPVAIERRMMEYLPPQR